MLCLNRLRAPAINRHNLRLLITAQVERSHNPLVAGSSPARRTVYGLVGEVCAYPAAVVEALTPASPRRVGGLRPVGAAARKQACQPTGPTLQPLVTKT